MKICLSCTKNEFFFTAASAVKKTPFLMQLKQMFGPSYFLTASPSTKFLKYIILFLWNMWMVPFYDGNFGINISILNKVGRLLHIFLDTCVHKLKFLHNYLHRVNVTGRKNNPNIWICIYECMVVLFHNLPYSSKWILGLKIRKSNQ